MQFRPLGRSGLLVSTLTMGTMTFGGRGNFAKTGNTDIAGAARQVDMCLDAGVNLLDTADVYSHGASEEIIGEVLRGRRHRTLVATKARFRMGEGPNQVGLSRHHLIAACKASMKRLGIDHIDLYQLHEWDGLTPLEETLEALDTLVRHGHVRYVGASNYSGWHLMKALAVQDRAGYVRLVSQQIHYTLEAREAEYELVPISLDQGLGILVWSPLAGGLLSGKYRPGEPPPPGARLESRPEARTPEAIERVEAFSRFAAERGHTVLELAQAALASQPAVLSVISGATSGDQVRANARAADWELNQADLEALARI